jgi:hypothetical protein
VSKVFKVNVESVEKLELKALKVIAVSLVCKVFPAHLYNLFPINFFFCLLFFSDTCHYPSKNNLICFTCRAPKVTEDRWVSLDLPENLENLDLKVLLAETEAQDLKALWDPLVLVVLLVNLVNLVLPALPVLPDLRDLLVNRWVTTLLHWPLSLDKVHQR